MARDRPVRAASREVQDVLDDAKATVASLHELATMTGAFLVDNIGGSGRWAGEGTIEMKDRAKERLLERLKALGLKDDALSEVSRGDRHWVCADYVLGIFGTPRNNPKWSTVSAEDSLALGRLMNRHEPASPDECETMLARLGVNEAFAVELLKDYRHYVRTGEHRRPAIWRSRQSWHSMRLAESR
jgi:hypothetical protein